MTSPHSIGPVGFGPGAELDLILRVINPDDMLPICVYVVRLSPMILIPDEFNCILTFASASPTPS